MTATPLRTALAGNAAFSLLSGAVFLLAPETIASTLGIDQVWAVQLLGPGLVAFALWVAHLAASPRPGPIRVLVTIAMDLGWVLGSAALLLVVGTQLTTTGVWIIAGIAALVGLLATWQLVGLARMYRPDPASREVRLCLRWPTQASSERVWNAIADVGRIDRYAPHVLSSRLQNDGPPKVGSVRECEAMNGTRWAERIIELDPAHRRLNLEFDAEAPDFPFPFSSLRGGWAVDEQESGNQVSIWLEGTPTRAGITPLLMPLMERKASRDFARIIAAMAGSDSSNHDRRPVLGRLGVC